MTRPAFEIRRANADDVAALAHHRVGTFRDMGSIHPTREEELRAEATKSIRDAMGSGEYVAWSPIQPANLLGSSPGRSSAAPVTAARRRARHRATRAARI